MKDYHINIFCSEEDGEYIADIPDLEPCSASGKTPEEARDEGLPIPEPRYRPAIYQVGTYTSERR